MIDAAHVQRQVRAYVGVFIALCVGTVTTVLVAEYDFSHMTAAIAVGSAIAIVKGAMVALVFMHLNHERSLIYFSLALTVVFFGALILLPVASQAGSSAIETHMYSREGGPPILGAVVVPGAAVPSSGGANAATSGAGAVAGAGDAIGGADASAGGGTGGAATPPVSPVGAKVEKLAGSAGEVRGKVTMAAACPPARELPEVFGDAACSAIVDVANLPKDPSFLCGDGGSLGNVLVYISAGLQGRQPPGTGTVTFDQKGCMYTPHVVAMQLGQTLAISNGDATLHNVHTRSKDNGELNRGQPAGSAVVELKPRKAEVAISAKCDVHPWMNAWIGVFDHPYFAVSAVDGSFTIPGKLPAGKYTLTAWHEVLPAQSAEIEVTADGGVQVSFVMGVK
jgi:caa(3)-type oxidase subunit IV